jgi:methionyl-tRNA synthetase
MPITIDDFKKVELKVATVKAAELHPNANKLLVLKLALGESERQVVSGIRQSYPDPQALVGKQVILIANLEPATIRGVESQGMILATQDASGISVLAPDRAVQPGSAVS